ncbi:recombinase family protein [Bacillus dakarensis]|uniref:recombinase family protein n=1 Tax=Robertmurraya dakarensis TaxID=1926278 RepID=UPI00098241B4|nr:recombinase family protein [Bacillus dakarensis]
MRCAVYARVSTNLESQATSIENQIDIFNNYASQKNWEIVKVYTDKQTGTKENRPGLKSLIEDGKNGVYDVILAKELSRLARNGRLSYELRDICHFNNLHIICLDNSINTLEGNDQNFGLFAWLYETESANSSRRNKQAKKVKAQRGLYIGSHPPYGYRVDNGVLKLKEDDTTNVVKRIFRDYLDGIGMETIAKNLTNEKVPTPAKIANKSNASKQWHGSTIKHILCNRHYIGDLVQGRSEMITVTSSQRREVDKENQIIHENTHEAIIEKETFNKVQELLRKRTKTGTAPQKHLFTNLLYCEDCQKGMWYKQNQKGYRCGGNLRHGEVFCVNKTIVREKALVHVIMEDLKPLYNTLKEESFLKSLVKKLESKKHQIQKELENVQAEIDNLKQNKLKYLNLYTENVISKDELIEARELTDANINELQLKKTQLIEKMNECDNENYAVHIGEKLKDVISLDELTPQVLHSLVEKITCTHEGEIHIQYSFVNPLQVA